MPASTNHHHASPLGVSAAGTQYTASRGRPATAGRRSRTAIRSATQATSPRPADGDEPHPWGVGHRRSRLDHRRPALAQQLDQSSDRLGAGQHAEPGLGQRVPPRDAEQERDEVGEGRPDGSEEEPAGQRRRSDAEQHDRGQLDQPVGALDQRHAGGRGQEHGERREQPRSQVPAHRQAPALARPCGDRPGGGRRGRPTRASRSCGRRPRRRSTRRPRGARSPPPERCRSGRPGAGAAWPSRSCAAPARARPCRAGSAPPAGARPRCRPPRARPPRARRRRRASAGRWRPRARSAHPGPSRRAGRAGARRRRRARDPSSRSRGRR